MEWRDIVYGTKEESDHVTRLLSNWKSGTYSHVDQVLEKLEPIARRNISRSQCELLMSMTKKHLLAGDPVRARKIWSACMGPMCPRSLVPMAKLFKEWLVGA